MSAEDTEEVARRLAREAVRFPDVVSLSSGSFGTLATPVPGGRVDGVAVRGDSVEVGVVVRFGRPLPRIAAEVRQGLLPLAGGRTVHVSVEDVIAGLG
ncbi:hypothetical protein [Nocardiopsis algeriensis]|uniref:Putative alkaline shock family protein YloU n=1 Tax=Nocardiopsis algeriensis TaxID=1478215 RepID=A0A841IW61_9ACTN|nr:putative alkaline shock family protein YloU [Nocardiopsis algeriensis]